MPAIHLERLDQQIKAVFDPELPGSIFLKNFQSFLDIHSNLAYQPSQELQRKSIIPKLHLAPIVMHQIQLRFSTMSKSNPQLAIEYADQLWGLETYETKLFSAIILGNLEMNYLDEITTRFVKWGSQTSDYEVHQILFTHGTKNIKRENENAWLEILQSWIDSNNANRTITAIFAIRSLIREPSFENFPRIYKMISPILAIDDRKIITTLQQLILDLAEINPNETAHFLSSTLMSSPPALVKLLIRKNLKSFPKQQQITLREALTNVEDG